MPTVRAQRLQLPVSIPGLSVASYGTSTAVPIGISNDRKTVYGATTFSGGTTLYQSVDDCTTWTTVTTFGEQVMSCLETDDGEVLVATQYTSGTILSYVYKSTGWAASHTAATWTKVLSTIGGRVIPYWGGGHFCTFGNDKVVAGTSKYGVLSEYGVQTTGSGDQTQKGRRVWFTADYGATWPLIFDSFTRYALANMHVHATAYDPWWDRIWLTHGDTTAADGTSYAQILYSDDHGTTWTPIVLGPEWTGLGDGFQSTSIAALKDCVMFGADRYPAYRRLTKVGYRRMGDIQPLSTVWPHSSNGMIATGTHQNRNSPEAPLLSGFMGQTDAALQPQITISLDNGASMHRLWGDDNLRGTASVGLGPLTMFGPTYNGKIVASIAQSATVNWLLVGELIVPDVGMIEGIGTVTGDATTTVFNFAHGMPAAPSRFQAWLEKPTAIAITITATSTNIVLSFATAPASGVVLPVQWRAAP